MRKSPGKHISASSRVQLRGDFLGAKIFFPAGEKQIPGFCPGCATGPGWAGSAPACRRMRPCVCTAVGGRTCGLSVHVCGEPPPPFWALLILNSKQSSQELEPPPGRGNRRKVVNSGSDGRIWSRTTQRIWNQRKRTRNEIRLAILGSFPEQESWIFVGKSRIPC